MAGEIVRVGNVEILALSDGVLEFDLCNFFPTIPETEWDPHAGHLTPEHKVSFNLGSYLIRSDGRTILVDTGLGPRPAVSSATSRADGPDVPWGKLLHDFAARGVRPDEVDMVVMTHAHRDHIGWNLQAVGSAASRAQGGGWVPTFPNARYWVPARDWAACHEPELQPTRFPNAPTCLWPLAELGLIELMEGEHPLTRELSALPTPGHTPGHMSLLVTSGGERALVLGDAAHTPVQIEEPDWVSRADMDPDLTRRTRRALLERLEREDILVAAGHFPAPGFGRIVSLGRRRFWRGMEFSPARG